MVYNCLHGKAPATVALLSQMLPQGVICVLPVVVNYSVTVELYPSVDQLFVDQLSFCDVSGHSQFTSRSRVAVSLDAKGLTTEFKYGLAWPAGRLCVRVVWTCQ